MSWASPTRCGRHDANHSLNAAKLPRVTIPVGMPPPIELRSGNAEERREYKRLYAEYQAAVNLPTDNETSGARLFEFTSERVA